MIYSQIVVWQHHYYRVFRFANFSTFQQVEEVEPDDGVNIVIHAPAMMGPPMRSNKYIRDGVVVLQQPALPKITPGGTSGTAGSSATAGVLAQAQWSSDAFKPNAVHMTQWQFNDGSNPDFPVPSPMEMNFEKLDEKPWKKEGADITDFFNYGMTSNFNDFICFNQLIREIIRIC